MHKSTAIALLISLVAVAGTSNVASAQQKTRAQVRQELITAENNGMDNVSNASYPDVATIYKDQGAQRKGAGDSGTGAMATTASEAGHAELASRKTGASSCVGPVTFCSPFFGG
jgi:Domain of unknown function (DUF4148)